MKTKLLLLLLAAAISFQSCEKGEKGDPGPQGTSGNANVQHYEVNVNPNEWTYNQPNLQHTYNYTVDFVTGSAVMVYVIINSVSGKQVLPYENNLLGVRYDFALYDFVSPSYIQLQYKNFSSATTAPGSNRVFTIVIIPPSLINSNSDIDWSNYSQVKAKFNLEN